MHTTLGLEAHLTDKSGKNRPKSAKIASERHKIRLTVKYMPAHQVPV